MEFVGAEMLAFEKEFVAQEAKWFSTETVIFITTKPNMMPSFPYCHEMISAFTFHLRVLSLFVFY